MGCDFNLVIQVRYGQMWVNIVNFGTKTRCGGYPLCAAPATLFKETGIDGKYHSGEPESLMVDEVFIAMGLEPKKEGKRVGTRLADCMADYDEEGAEAKFIPQYLHYSADEFKELIQRIPLLGENHPDDYRRLMASVSVWMEIALTAYPKFKEIWMPDEQEEIDGITQSLLESQQFLADTYKDMLVKAMQGNKYCLSDDLVRYIAEFSSPRGSDVRLAWNDDEGHCHDVSKYEGCIIC